MDERMQRLDSFIETLKAQGQKLPNHVGQDAPHFRMIAAAAGIDFRYLIKEPYRQRVMLAVQEVGLTPKEGTETSRAKTKFVQNHGKLNNYIGWLHENGFKLPEDPTRKGKVFFAQVAIEAGLTPHAMTLKKTDGEEAYNARLRKAVESAAVSLGIEVRVLPQSPGDRQTPFTYELLFEKGTEERKKELTDSPSAGAQLSNTKYALNLFLKTLEIEATATVGHEFVAGFKSGVEKVMGKITNVKSRKKFQTEIHRWQDIYQRLLKGPSIPDDIHQAIVHLIDRSSLSLSVLAKLIGIALDSLRAWYHWRETPSELSRKPLERMELLFKIPAGTLVNKILGLHGRKRFRLSEFPPFLQENPKVFYRISRHLPDNFCTLPLEKQEKIVESIRADILRGDDEYAKRLLMLSRHPYRLTDWPLEVLGEFNSYSDFKMGERPPLGMHRNGTWGSETKRKCEDDLSYLFGALCLPQDAKNELLRGLSFPQLQLTMALFVCPTLIDWYIRFRCKTRNQYTEYPIDLLTDYISMLQPKNGWLRQSPHLAGRLRPFSAGETHYVPEALVARAQTDWARVCDDAIAEYQKLIEDIEPLVTVARDPFHRIEGLLDMKDPMEALGLMIQEMRRDLPNRYTQPVLYHTGIRDCALVILIVLAGLRVGTIEKLKYTGDRTGHLYFERGRYVLSVPRKLFKNPNSSFFGPKGKKKDYLNRLPDKYGLNEVFKEYLDVSRPFLMEKYHKQSSDQPLFVPSFGTGSIGTEPESAGLSAERMSAIYANKVERYLVENKHRGTGITKVKRTGPHSVRHVRGTKAYRITRSYKPAGDANQNSERTARKHYSRDSTEERNREVNEILFDDEDE